MDNTDIIKKRWHPIRDKDFRMAVSKKEFIEMLDEARIDEMQRIVSHVRAGLKPAELVEAELERDKKLKNQIKFSTNTAWLLNMWFRENDLMWAQERKWIQAKHDEMWKRKHQGIVEVTFRIKEETT